MKPAIILTFLYFIFPSVDGQIISNDSIKFYWEGHNFYVNTGVSIGVAEELRTYNNSRQHKRTVANFNNSIQLGYLKGEGNRAFGAAIGYYNHSFYNLGVITAAAEYRRFLSKSDEKGFYLVGQAGVATVLSDHKYIEPSLGYHLYVGLGYSKKHRTIITSVSIGLQATQANHVEPRLVDELGVEILPQRKTLLGLRRADLVRCEVLF